MSEWSKKCYACNGTEKDDCPDCNGKKRVKCEVCGGKGEVACETCNGTGRIYEICPNCNEGQVPDPQAIDDDTMMECPVCHGNWRKEVGVCEDCNGTGKVECDECDHGWNECETCDGTGKVLCTCCDGDLTEHHGEVKYLADNLQRPSSMPAYWKVPMLLREGMNEYEFAGYKEGDVDYPPDMPFNVFSRPRGFYLAAKDGVFDAAVACVRIYLGDLPFLKEGQEMVREYLDPKKEEIYDCLKKGVEAGHFLSMYALRKEQQLLGHTIDDERPLLKKEIECGAWSSILELLDLSMKAKFRDVETIRFCLEKLEKGLKQIQKPGEFESYIKRRIDLLGKHIKAFEGNEAEAVELIKDFYACSQDKGLQKTEKEWLDRDLKTLLAEIGGAAAEFWMAEQYYEAKDYSNAELRYQRAIELGSVDAMLALGKMARNGECPNCKTEAKCSEKSRKLYEKAAAKGSAEGMFWLGRMHQEAKEWSEANAWFEKAAAKGNRSAVIWRARNYRQGKGTQDCNQAFVILYEAFEGSKGSTRRYIICGLAYCYVQGLVGSPDYEKANILFRRAANGGNSDALYALGHAYLEGKGVPKNLPEAKRLLQMAADKGDTNAPGEIKKLLGNVKASQKPISGVDGTPGKGPLPSYVTEDYKRASKGKIKKIYNSEKKRWRFVLFGIVAGWTGFHFLYIKRWGLAILYWAALLTCFVGGGDAVEVVTSFISNPGDSLGRIELSTMAWVGFGGAVLSLLIWIGSVFVCKYDGKGKRLS